MALFLDFFQCFFYLLKWKWHFISFWNVFLFLNNDEGMFVMSVLLVMAWPNKIHGPLIQGLLICRAKMKCLHKTLELNYAWKHSLDNSVSVPWLWPLNPCLDASEIFVLMVILVCGIKICNFQSQCETSSDLWSVCLLKIFWQILSLCAAGFAPSSRPKIQNVWVWRWTVS